MALKNRQSALEASAIKERNKELDKNRNYGRGEGREYNSSHEKAKSTPDSPHGKGVENSDHQIYVPELEKNSTTRYRYDSLNTEKGGGLYDIKGRNGDGGRERLLEINLYDKNNEYGPGLIDMSANLDDGQYIINLN